MTQLEETLNEAAAAEETLNEATEEEAETTHDIEEQYTSALGRAIAYYWQSGSYIPLELAAELMAAGYDVGSLEARYLKD